MAFKIYVGNLPWIVTDETLRQLFESFGIVVSAEVVVDRKTGRHRGFGFVRMESADAGRQAIDALHGMHWQDRQIKVAVARETESGSPPPSGK